ncbi:MAG: RNA-binding S4 domain-containing protein [Clostridia bacterium]|nr:RNA-binding S4 domain-containing protein [Clostridia bacterium]
MERKVKKIKVRLLQTEEKKLPITTPFIKLDAALKFSDIAQTGGHAKILVEDGKIRVNGEVCTSRGKKLAPGDTFEYKNLRYTVMTADEDQ